MWGPYGKNIKEPRREWGPMAKCCCGGQHEGFLLEYLNVPRTQGMARRRTCGKVKPYHFAVPGHLGRAGRGGCSQPACGDVETSCNMKF